MNGKSESVNQCWLANASKNHWNCPDNNHTFPVQLYTSLLCRGAVLARSSDVGVRHSFMIEQILQDKTTPNYWCIYKSLPLS